MEVKSFKGLNYTIKEKELGRFNPTVNITKANICIDLITVGGQVWCPNAPKQGEGLGRLCQMITVQLRLL